MDSLDSLEDKDGAEVQLNFPPSAAARVEALLGGEEQFDRADFDAVAYINQVFPTEQSLSGVEALAARCAWRLQAAQADARAVLRAQAAQREAGQQALLNAQKCIADLGLQVGDINVRAERSEAAVREITAEIKQLDCAKSNLTAAITALNHYHMLAGGAAALGAMTRRRQYKELLLPLQAIMEVLQHFENYKDIRELNALREQVRAIREQLAAQILADFKEAFTGGSKSTISHRSLSEACAVAEALCPRVRRELLQWFLALRLQEYEHLFASDQECAWLEHVERRYAWLKKHLLTFEESLGAVFPPAWAVSELIARRFCDITRAQLAELLGARRAELDVKLLLFAVQKTCAFELLLHKRFVGTDLPEGAERPPEPLESGEKEVDDVGVGVGVVSGGDGASGGWVGSIGRCFEPYLSLYISSLDASLRALMDRTVQEARAPGAAGAAGAAGAGGGAVLASCADLFLFYKKCLVQCARLSTGQPMLELAGVFQKYLREYAASVLQAALPRGGGAAGAGAGALQLAALGAVTNLHTLLRDDGGAGGARYTKQEISRITSVITTSEYCLETTIHLEQKLKEKISPALAPGVDLSAEQGQFHKLIDSCIQLLVRDLEAACEPALQAMTKISWLHFENVGDQSSYITQIVMHLTNAVPTLRDSLASSRKYFTQLCIRFASSFIPKFIQSVYECRPICAVGAEQLLLDAHMLKTALLALPALGSAVRRPAPATYTKVVIKLMTKAEMVLKLVLAPAAGAEALVAQCAQLLPDFSPAELRRLLLLRGERCSKQQLAALERQFREATRGAAADGAGK